MKDDIVASVLMCSAGSYLLGIVFGQLIHDYQSWFISLIGMVITFGLMMYAANTYIQELINRININMGLISKEITQDCVHYIFHESNGKTHKHYYFVETSDASEAVEIARAYKSPTPQCFERWTIKQPMTNGDIFHHKDISYKVPNNGFVMVFTSHSPE